MRHTDWNKLTLGDFDVRLGLAAAGTRTLYLEIRNVRLQYSFDF